MPVSTIGDMRQYFMTSRANYSLKTDMQTLVEELTTGEKSDLTAHLGTNQTKLNSIDRQLEMLGTYAQSSTGLSQLLSTMQIALDGVDGQRSATSDALLTVNSGSSLSQIENVSNIALSGFETTVSALNTRYGDRSLFGGNDVDTNPLASSDVMMEDIRLAVSGLTTEADISSALDTWFDDPAGGFHTLGYQGDETGTMTRPVGANQTIDVDARADDPSIRDTMKAMALGALAGDTSLSLDLDTRRSMQKQAGDDLLTVASPLVDLQARLGYAEGQVEEASVRISAQQSSYGIARNDLVSADPFETATRLQSVQLQLETQYTLTARLSRLSLMEYLR
ncbi:flagellin [Octadecabacter sp. 1_MG-2023]|uniref:flagellin n=1 Tax=unclassified Octadecabacter TaxID=196158 RepID=UPI001C0902BA|nr:MULTISPECIES: flagellin [unclassified Octadecabacter]MBU2992367.1 flagellar biosynthesis protein FlgL [Octadecabacter sp. B2R22]MDO6734876.1 flagellin [Octadecabacter sp. 1_MG-2023]